MKTIRIGNDIVVTWSLFKEGQPYSLADMDVTLYLSHAFGKTTITDYHVNDNKIVWTFKGKEQQHSGKYSLELVINEAQDGMASTDYCNFVNLAQTTPCCEGEDDEDVVTEYVELTSSVNYAPVVINEGGGAGLQYATERTVYITWDEGICEITEEQREYNKETFALAFSEDIFISYQGLFFPWISSNGRTLNFSYVGYDAGILIAIRIILHENGDAEFVLEPIETGSGLQYVIERTVYPNRMTYYGEEVGEPIELTEEQKAYNIETVDMHVDDKGVFISLAGYFLHHAATAYDGHFGPWSWSEFTTLMPWDDVIDLLSVTITADGNATLEFKEFETGSAPSTPSDMNSDFSNDF